MAVAVVKPVTKDRIVISLSPGYTAVSFKLASGGAEVVILDKNSTETTRLAVAPPEPGHVLKINTSADGVEIVYE
jgi:hypothetical protein